MVEGPQRRLYELYVVILVASVLISNVIAQKLFVFGPTSFTAGIILFPIAYIASDVLTEVYGFRLARRAIWLGFLALVMLVIFSLAAIHLPPSPVWPNQSAFEITLAQVPRTVAASILAYLAGEFANAITLSWMKVRSGGRNLYGRVIGSTVVGQGIDTIVFALVAFVGIFPLGVIVQIAAFGYAFKVLYEIVVSPLTYRVITLTKRIEGIDVFDEGVSYNPLPGK